MSLLGIKENSSSRYRLFKGFYSGTSILLWSFYWTRWWKTDKTEINLFQVLTIKTQNSLWAYVSLRKK